MGGGRAEGSSAIGDGGQAAMSLSSDVDGTQVHIFESLQLEGLYIFEEDFLPNVCKFVLNCSTFLLRKSHL